MFQFDYQSTNGLLYLLAKLIIERLHRPLRTEFLQLITALDVPIGLPPSTVQMISMIQMHHDKKQSTVGIKKAKQI